MICSKWFTKGWYQYLFAKRGRFGYDVPWITVILCRLRDHPFGVIWYNPNGFEPDMTCKNCGDDLG